MKIKWQKRLNRDPIPWLLESNPWTRYRTFTDLMDMPTSSAETKEVKEELRNNLQIKDLIAEASD